MLSCSGMGVFGSVKDGLQTMTDIPEALVNALPEGGLRFSDRAEGALAGPGAYLLLVRMHKVMRIELARAPHLLPPRWYIYAGSANGPGGMAARVARHMRREKKPHWHIDRITCQIPPETAFCFPGHSECGLVESLVASNLFEFPLQGFGSSDCKVCESHLLRWRGP